MLLFFILITAISANAPKHWQRMSPRNFILSQIYFVTIAIRSLSYTEDNISGEVSEQKVVCIY